MKSLQLKLLLSFMLVIIFLLAGVLIGVSVLVKEQTIEAKQQELIGKGQELAGKLKEYYIDKGNFAGLETFLSQADSYLGARIWILDETRQVITMSGKGRGLGKGHDGSNNRGTEQGAFSPPGRGFQSQSSIHAIIPQLDPVFRGENWTKTIDSPYDEQMLVIAVPIMMENSRVSGAVLLNAPVADIDDFMNRMYIYIAAAGFIAVLLALIVVSYLTFSIVRPLKAMQETAHAMAQGNYDRLVNISSQDEVGRLGVSLNSLAHDLSSYIKKLDTMDKMRRDFLANVSHELRTPLTVIRGYYEALSDGIISEPAQIQKYYDLIKNELLRQERLIHDLLDLSQLQSAASVVEKGAIPLNSIVDHVIRMLQKQAEQKDICLIASTRDPLPPIDANGDRMIQLILILVDNAITYTPSGGTVSVRTFVNGDAVSIEIADTGIGIPAEDIPYIWERFYKVDKAHSRSDSGTGLGLAIAKQIIELHQASVTVASRLGQGTSITIEFPADVRYNSLKRKANRMAATPSEEENHYECT